MMIHEGVAVAEQALDEGRAVATIVAAFAADPIVRWFYPDPARYLEQFPQLVRVMGREAFDVGTADAAPGYAGAALWVAPGVALDEEALGGLIESGIDAERQDDMYAFLEQVAAHHPSDAVWYLPFIGVDPYRQGHGHGSALLERGLQRCDREHQPAYLEASSARNRALYERHGFEVVGEIQVADSPPLWPMVRAPR